MHCSSMPRSRQAGTRIETGGPSLDGTAKAPAIRGKDLKTGRLIDLAAYRGKPVFINVWASWCLPCRAETPALERTYRQYKDAGVVILGVNLTNQDLVSEVEAFVQEFSLTYPILLDRDGQVGNLYQIQGIPTTFFIDREGVIRTAVVGGPMSETFIRSKIEALLKEGD